MWQICRHWFKKLFMPGRLLQEKHVAFRKVLQLDSQSLDFLADLESHLLGQDPADPFRINNLCDQAIGTVGAMTEHLHAMNPPAYGQLLERHTELSTEIRAMMVQVVAQSSPPYILPLQQAADYPELAGGKAANLSAAERAGVTIPRGFVITTNAFHRFICDNKLENDLIGRLRQVHADDNDTIIRITGELQELILGCEIPADITDLIEQGVESLMPADRLAVRSSALAEDGLVSFAGQYVSELDVPASKVIAAYKRVIAGKYSPRAVTYRIRHGLSDAETAMAVLVLPMIQPRASGVMYTLDPGPPASKESLGVYAVAGLAKALVDGSRTPERYHLPRKNSLLSPQKRSAHDDAVLNTAQLQQLRTWGLQLESYFGYPLDIEWTLDKDGLTVLQSRRLHPKKESPPVIVPAVDPFGVLYSHLHCASAGIACGPVFFAPTVKTFRNIPHGSVVFTTNLRPVLSQFLDRVVGVIAANGSRASHFSSVARERGIPVLVGSEVELAAGQVVTLDAASGRVFNGCVNTVLQKGKRYSNKGFPTEKYVKLAARTTHLRLTNPDGDTFTLAECHSLHDMVRFCHEKSVSEMFRLVGRKGRGLGKARKLVTDLPLVIYVLDLEKRASVKASPRLTLAEISSVPMLSYWQGMSDSRISWDISQHHIDWEAFDQISGGIFPFDTKLLASYAIVSREYLHLNIRFGYHFSVVDAICGEQAGTNYLNFRFKGGGAAHRQKLFRLQFIDKALTALGFETASRGDMLDAAFARAPQPETKLALTRLGMLLAVTRLMDMRLTSTSQVTEEVEKFLVLVKETKSF